MKWFKNLKKWQKGGLIGCAVGLLLAGMIIPGAHPYEDPPWVWIYNFHIVPFAIVDVIVSDIIGSITHIYIMYIYNPTVWFLCGGLGAVVVCYGGFGAIVGRTQQMTNPFSRWLLTGLLAFFLLFIYWFNFQVAMFIRYL